MLPRIGQFVTSRPLAALLVGLAVLGSAKTASAQALPGTPAGGAPGFILEFDESGHGAIISDAYGSYPNPGAPQVGGGLLYTLPVTVIPGDIAIYDTLDVTPTNPTGFSDLLTFFGNNLLFRSLLEEAEPSPDPADVLGLAVPGTAISISESGPEGNNGFVWLVDSGGPSYTVYNGLSDSPEPASLALLGLGGAMMMLRRRKSP